MSLFCPSSKEQFSITHVKAKDEAVIRYIAKTTSEEIYGCAYDPRKYEALFREFGQDNAVYLMALLDGDVIGFAKILMLDNDGSRIARLDKLYFLDEYRGRGFGSKMMERCFAEAALRGAERMTLFVWSQNNGAIRFYERYGFHCPGLMPTVVVDDIEMSGAETFLFVCDPIPKAVISAKAGIRRK
jgi:putative acetyltransferase